MFNWLKEFWLQLARNQKIALSVLAAFLIIGPVSVILSPQPVEIFELGFPITPPVTPPVENFGYAIRYTSRSSAAVYANLIVPTANFTLEAWINPDPFPVETVERYIFSQTSDGTGQQISLALGGNSQLKEGNGELVARFYDNQGPHELRSGFAVSPGQWHHIAMVKTSSEVSLFIDGQLRISTPSLENVIVFNPKPFVIGNYVSAPSTQTNQFFGIIDEVRISKYSRYTSSFIPLKQPFFPDPDALALYHFDDNIQDNSANHQSTYIFGSVDFVPSMVTSPSPSPSPSPTDSYTPWPSPFLSPSPTFKPSPSPSSGPTNSPLPGFSPTPIPTPQPVSNAPIIITEALADARPLRYYNVILRGYDKDLKDNLNFSVSGLPWGLGLSRCTQRRSKIDTKIVCRIRGVPLQSFPEDTDYQIEITLKDSQNNEVKKTLPLKVLKLDFPYGNIFRWRRFF